MLLIAAICAVDAMSMDQEHASRVVPLRLALMLCPMGIAFVLSFVDGLRSYINIIVTAAAFLCGIGTFSDSFVAATMGQPVVLWGNIFFTFFVYLVLGLPFRHSIVAASPIFLISLLLGYLFDVPGHKIAYVFFSNVIGMYASYRLEQDARAIYRGTLQLEEVIRTDALTRIYNRRMFDEFFPRVWRQAGRDAKSVGVLLADIDYFKRYNDHYGHQAGDDCLGKIAAVLDSAVNRPLDFVARYGGEEFVIVLYEPNDAYLEKFGQEICDRVSALNIPHEGSRVSDRVTISAGGMLFYPNGQIAPEAALALVDAALYRAKNLGRNQVAIGSTARAAAQSAFPRGTDERAHELTRAD